MVRINGEFNHDFLLSLTEHYFIKNKEPTVMPYPVKYAREGAKRRGNAK